MTPTKPIYGARSLVGPVHRAASVKRSSLTISQRSKILAKRCLHGAETGSTKRVTETVGSGSQDKDVVATTRPTTCSKVTGTTISRRSN